MSLAKSLVSSRAFCAASFEGGLLDSQVRQPATSATNPAPANDNATNPATTQSDRRGGGRFCSQDDRSTGGGVLTVKTFMMDGRLEALRSRTPLFDRTASLELSNRGKKKQRFRGSIL